MRLEKADSNCFLHNVKSKLNTFEIPQGIFEVGEFINTLDNLLEAIVPIDKITIKPNLKTNFSLRFDKKPFYNTIL